jgi:tight adherence protein C
MNQDHLLLVYGLMAGLILFVALAAVMLWREARLQDLEARVLQAATGSAGAERPNQNAPLLGRLVRMLHDLGERIRRGGRLYSQEDLAGIEGAIAAAGLNPKRVLPVVLGGKVALMVLLPLSAILYTIVADASLQTRVVSIIGAAAAGMMGPDWVLNMLRRPYVKALRRGVADALDLMVVCTEAGMGLESALEQVAREMRHSNPPMATALTGLLDELKVLPDRRQAFENFGKRSGVDGLQRLATMLAQSMQYGTPLSQALRAIATELRHERTLRLEEKAAKLPAKLVLPLIVFILPSLFIVLVGSAFLRLFDSLAMMSPTSH